MHDLELFIITDKVFVQQNKPCKCVVFVVCHSAVRELRIKIFLPVKDLYAFKTSIHLLNTSACPKSSTSLQGKYHSY